MDTQGVAKPVVMFGLSLGLTAKGVHDFMESATSVVGFITACLGCAAAVCALIWWVRKLKKQ